MSWSISATGTPAKVIACVRQSLTRYTPGSPSRIEFEAVAESICTQVAAVQGEGVLVKLNAHGNGMAVNGVVKNQTVAIHIETVAPNC